MRRSAAGFTLLEILIALFIFTIISMMLASALHTVMNALTGTEENADKVRKLQMALLIMSRDVEQILSRPILDIAGNEEASFTGTSRSFTFTHVGYANLAGTSVNGGMQRTRYYADQNALWRMNWAALDQAPTSRSHARALLDHVTDVRFQYLDDNGRFQSKWPVEGQPNQLLPRAVAVSLTISNWGKINQLYVISAEASKNALQPATNNPSRRKETEY